MATDRATVEGQYQGTANLEARIAIHERYSTNQLGLPRWLFEQMALPARARLLEVGCGVGTIWTTNLDRIPPGWRITLTDRSPAMVQEATRRIGAGNRQFTFATAPAGELPFRDSSVDAVIAHFMLYHVSDVSRVLAEICRVLRSGGWFFAATNGARHMREARRFAADVGLIGGDVVDAGDTPEFDLENGGARLSPWFTGVALHRYDDALMVPESDLLLAYILSGIAVQAALDRLGADEAERRVAALRALLAQRLAAEGVIRVTKDSGLFIARRAGCTMGDG